MKLYIRAYPKFTTVASAGSLSDLTALCRKLDGTAGISSFSLYSCEERYYLCFRAEVRRLESLLGDICEHSERVFIGDCCCSVIREHCKQVLRDDAHRRSAQK